MPGPDALIAPDEPDHDVVAVRVDHPLVEKLAALPPGVAGVLLAHGVRVALEGHVPVGWRAVQSAVDALDGEVSP